VLRGDRNGRDAGDGETGAGQCQHLKRAARLERVLADLRDVHCSPFFDGQKNGQPNLSRLRTRAEQRSPAVTMDWFQSEPQSLQQELSTVWRGGNRGSFPAHFRKLRALCGHLFVCCAIAAEAMLDAL